MTEITDQERYSRQIMIEGFGPEGQERLKAAKILIAGAGGLGSPQAIYLAAAGVGRILLLDMDVVATSNLNRQILHWEENLGEPKVNSALEKLRRINSTIGVDVRNEKITEENVDEIISGQDLVLDALDNFDTRKVLNQACMRQGIPFIYGGVYGLTGMLSTFVPGQTACLQCLFPGDLPAATFPVLGPTPGVIASLQATEAIKHLVGLGRPLYDRLLIYDGLDMSFKEITIQRREDCPACGQFKDSAG